MNVKYLKTAITDYKVGALTASSKFVVKKILKELADVDHNYIVEYGAGDGVITRSLVEILDDNGRVVAIETNPSFIKELRFLADNKIDVVPNNVLDVVKDFSSLGLPRVDAVISGIPFSFFSGSSREEIISSTHQALEPGGLFILYQYSILVLPLLKRYFSEVKVSFEPRNFPPYFIMKAKK